MDNSYCNSSCSSPEAVAPSAALESGFKNPRSSSGCSKVSVRVSEDRRDTRDAHRPPPLQPLSLTSSPFPSGIKELRVSEDRRTSRNPYCPLPSQTYCAPNLSLVAGVVQPHPPLLSDRVKVEKSEDRRTPRPEPCPGPTTPHPYGVSVAGKSEVSRTLRPALLLPSTLSYQLAPPEREAHASAPTDSVASAGHGKEQKKRRTRRAGRKNQLRRLWNTYRGIDLSDGAEHPCMQADSPPVASLPTLEPPRRLRIVEDVIYKGPRITKWVLTPLNLNPIVYPANVPLLDPRRKEYLQKRANLLYPLPYPSQGEVAAAIPRGSKTGSTR